MITKRTRALSIFAAVLMLVSMFACFVIPASAETEDPIAAVKAMYADVLANASADADGALAAALEAEYADAATAKTELAAIAGASITLKDGIKPRVAYTSAYKAAGYTGTNWSISKAEDWLLMISGEGNANAASQSVLHSYYVTNDIDFEGVSMEAIACFRGNIYGQNHVFKNVNIQQRGAGSSNNNGAALMSRTGAGAAGAQVIRDLGVTGKVTAKVSGAAGTAVYCGTFVGSNENVTISNCWSDADISFTNAGTSSGAVYVGGIVAHTAKPLTGCSYSGTMTFSSTSTGNDHVGGIAGYTSGSYTVANCAFTGTIVDNSASMGTTGDQGVAGLIGRTYSNTVINNCISTGTIISTAGPAVALSNFNNAGKVYNTIAGGFVLAGGDLTAGSALKSHSTATNGATYAVNMPFVFYKAADGQEAEATLNANASKYAASAAEAAYKINNGYNTTGGTQTFYTVDAEGNVAFGTAENQVQKVVVTRGETVQNFYFAKGSTVKLADIYADKAESTSVDGDSFTVTGDMEITVVDSVESAKDVLAAAEEAGWDSKDLNMYTETAAWLAAADALAANDEAAVADILAKAAELPGLIAGNATLNLDTAAYAPYSKKNAYKNLGCTKTTAYSINSKEDWLALVTESNANNNTSNAFAQTYHVLNDIDMENIEMQPFCYYYQTNASIKGYGHAFKNINVKGIYTGDTTTGANRGFGLISKINNGVDDLHIESGLITVEVQNATQDGKIAYIGGITGNGAITNCSSAATLKVTAASTIPTDVKIYVGGLVANTSVVDCNSVHTGTVDVDLSGVAAAATADKSYIIGGVAAYSQGNPSSNEMVNKGTVKVKTSAVTASAQYTYTGGVVGYARMPIINCINEGTVIVESKYARAGGIAGGVEAGKNIYKCLNAGDVTINGTGDHVGGIVGSGTSSSTLDSCLNTGNVTASAGQAMAIYGYGGNAAKVYNTIAAGTARTAGYRFHANIYGAVSRRPLFNSYAVGMTLLNYNGTPANEYVDGLTIDIGGDTGKAFTDETFNAYYALDSVGEAAWAANNNHDTTLGNAQVYYTLVDGQIAFGTAENQVRKITLAGEANGVIYASQGALVDLTEYVMAEYLESYSSDEVTVAGDNTFTVPASDVTITVKYTDAAIAATKADLKELIDFYAQYDLDLLDGSSTVGSWLTAANAAWADEDATYTDVFAQVVAADAIVIKLVDGAKPVYSKVDLYKDYNTAKAWSISNENDWIRLTEDYEGKNGNPTLYVTGDIEFTKNMLPLCYGAEFSGTIHGNDHIFKNIKIEMAGGVGNSYGVSLIAAGSFTIENLGITGEVTNTATSGAVRTAAFVAGTGYATLKNCWTAVDVTGPTLSNSARAQYLGVFAPDPTQKDTITNCFNVGTVTSTNNGGASVFYSYAANSTVKNSIDAGTINTTSAAKGSIVSHPNGFLTANAIGNNASVNNDLWYLISAQEKQYIVQLPGSENACDTLADVNAFYKADSIGAAAYKVNAGANDAVYYKLDATYGLAYGDANTQVRKVTFINGEDTIVTYANQGDVLNVDQFGGFGGLSTYTVNGEAIDASYKVPGDIEVTVTSTIPDGYTDALNTLNALSEKYAGYLAAKKAAEILSNYAEIEAAKTLIDNTIAATEGSNDTAAYQAVINLAGSHTELAQVVTGKVPYAAKADYPATTEYGIYDEADWNAAVLASSNFTADLHLMNSITLTAAETAPFVKMSGTFYGHENTISGVKITKLTNGMAGLFLTNAGKIQDLTVEGSITINYTDATLDPYVAGIVASSNGKSIDNCVNNVDISGTIYGKSNNMCVGGVSGYLGIVTNSTNNGNITLNTKSLNRVHIGGVVGRINASCTGNINNGDLTVVQDEGSTGNVFVAGIAVWNVTDSADTSNNTNTGDINVTARSVVGVGGLFADVVSGADARGYGSNSGDITVTAVETGTEIFAAGLYNAYNATYRGAAHPTQPEGMVSVNSGAITVYSNNPYRVEVNGVSNGSAAATISASNSGVIEIYGADASDNRFSANAIMAESESYTVTGENTGSLTICDHSDSTYTHIDGHHRHSQLCNVEGCGYYVEEAACNVESWTWDDVEGAGDYTHSGFCTLCEEVYSEACTYEVNEHEEDCTLDTEVDFTCFCGREDLVLEGTGNGEHTYGDWKTEGATEGYERHTCENCDYYEERTFVSEELRGDADRSGSVDLIDAIIALRESVDMNVGDVCDTAFADMNMDGKVDQDDAVLIVRKWLKNV